MTKIGYLKINASNPAMARLAKALREAALVNHGLTVIEIVHPNGQTDRYTVTIGGNPEEHLQFINNLPWRVQ